MRAPFEIAGATHAGRVRPNNEDRIVVDAAHGLAVVADGMGGERGGERAAEEACRAVSLAVAAALPDAPALKAAIGTAGARVKELATGGNPDDANMGATLGAVRIVASEAVVEIAHVGDVRVYVLRRAAAATLSAGAPTYCPPALSPKGALLVCATRDHSSLCELVERGHAVASVASHPLRNRINRALGRAGADPEVRIVPLIAGDRLVVCSDGLWAAVENTEIARMLEEARSPEAACTALRDAALDSGGADNIGIAVVFWYGVRREAVVAAPKPDPKPAPVSEEITQPAIALPPTLARWGRDLTDAARRGELDPVIGRKKELRELQYTLIRHTKPNAMLIGEPGVGKTSIVEALALRVAAGEVIDELTKLRVVELTLTGLVADTPNRGMLESRIAEILETAEAMPELVLFVDEVHALIGGSDAPGTTIINALKPALARGRIRLIGATTNAEYERHIQRDEAFARRFENIYVPEPSTAETREMLSGLRARLEAHYRVKIDDSAVDGAINLSGRYMPDRRHPDKSLDLLDRACARRLLDTLARRGHAQPITRRDVALAVAERIGIPVNIVDRDVKELLVTVEHGLSARIKGQDPALAAVNEALRRGHSPLHDPVRPIASLLFVGPTGVGKTATAKLIAELLYGRDALVRIDMSELADRQAVTRLVGAAPGYAGHGDEGQLTGPVTRKPACVVLFDEVEKAHHEARMLLLQILSDGALTDARGKRVSFRETVVVMTTNLEIAPKKRIGGFGREGGDLDTDDVDLNNRQELAKTLTPELIGRIDAVVAYRGLDRKDYQAIVDAVVAGFEARLRAQGVAPPPGAPVREAVLRRLDASRFGVRDVERFAEDEIARALEVHEPPSADAVLMDSIRTRPQVSMLLVDIVNSTRLLANVGETQFVHTVRRLADAVKCHVTSSDLQFLKCTGDGVLALYGSVDAALEMGRSLGRTGPVATLRRVVHWGRVRHGPMGDFLGIEMHRVFRIESVHDEDRIGEGPPIPDAPFLISAAAREHLHGDHQARLQPAGAFKLAGFGEAIELWLYEEGT